MHEKILVIEDEKDLQIIYAAILEEEGFDVSVANDFSTAIGILETQAAEVVFSDIILGGRTGVDILRAVRERGLNCPVVLKTGIPTVETAAEAVRLGAYDYIPKPVAPETLIRVASMALRFKKLNDQYEASRKNLEAIFSSVKDAIITVDKNQIIIEMNEAAQGLCGLKDLAIGKPIEPPLLIMSLRFWFVAAMILTSILRETLSPTRSTFLSCNTRSSLLCREGEMSPISSRKMVPPSAVSNLPDLSFIAPVNAPLTCPKSSLSRRLSERAAQLTLTSGPSFRVPV